VAQKYRKKLETCIIIGAASGTDQRLPVSGNSLPGYRTGSRGGPTGHDVGERLGKAMFGAMEKSWTSRLEKDGDSIARQSCMNGYKTITTIA